MYRVLPGSTLNRARRTLAWALGNGSSAATLVADETATVTDEYDTYGWEAILSAVSAYNGSADTLAVGVIPYRPYIDFYSYNLEEVGVYDTDTSSEVYPDDSTIFDGSYPLTMDFVAVTRSSADGPVGEWLHWMNNDYDATYPTYKSSSVLLTQSPNM